MRKSPKNKYQIYKDYKKLLNSVNIINMKEVEWGYALSLHIWQLFEYTSKRLFIALLKRFITIVFFQEYRIDYKNNDSSEILFCFVDRKRKDYDDIYEKVKSCTKNYNEVIISLEKKIDLKSIKNVKNIIKYYKALKPFRNKLFRLYFTLQILYYENLYKKK